MPLLATAETATLHLTISINAPLDSTLMARARSRNISWLRNASGIERTRHKMREYVHCFNIDYYSNKCFPLTALAELMSV